MANFKSAIMSLLESVGGLRLLQAFNKNKPIILMYHRILEHEYINGISPKEFEAGLKFLSANFHVVSINQLIHDLQNDCVKPYSLAITFDDGHNDFYYTAWPLLKKYNLPATLYVTTSFVSGEGWLWPDKLKYILLNSKAELIHSPLGPIPLDPNRHWENWHRCGDHCLTLTPTEREQFLNRLAQSANLEIPASPCAPFHGVTWEQLKEMVSEGLDIGSHTVTHPILKALSPELLMKELAGSKDDIFRALGLTVTGICYPNGRPEDLDPEVFKTAKKHGYLYGVMGRNLAINKGNLLQLGRLAAVKNLKQFRWALARHQQHATNSSYIN